MARQAKAKREKRASGAPGANAGLSPAPFDPPQWPAARVEMWKIGRIKPYDKNPRTHPEAQIEFLAASMRDEGVTMPILVDEGGVIIAGHGRLLAAIKNGFDEYPVVVARGWSEEKKRAARIRDNTVGLMSGWDAELIKGEIAILKTSGYEIPLLGFPEIQLRGWGISSGTDGATDPDDPVPEPPKNPVVRRGDLWLLGASVKCPKCQKVGLLESMLRKSK